MNKKIIMTSMIAIFAGFAAYANTVDIDADGNRLNSNPAVAANCTEPILGTYSGSTDFEAKWQANSIPLRWYSDDEQLQVQGEAGTCTYDAGLTVPSSLYQPSKRGYHFRGWTIRTASSGGNSGSSSSLCSFTPNSGVLTETTGQIWSKGYDMIANIDHCRTEDSSFEIYEETSEENPSLCSTSPFSDLNTNEWIVELANNGTIRGIASCNDTEAEYWNWGMPMPNAQFTTTDTGKYCWCKATSYTPNGGNMCTVASDWVFGYPRSSFDNCASMCAYDCADSVRYGGVLRPAILGAQ